MTNVECTSKKVKPAQSAHHISKLEHEPGSEAKIVDKRNAQSKMQIEESETWTDTLTSKFVQKLALLKLHKVYMRVARNLLVH